MTPILLSAKDVRFAHTGSEPLINGLNLDIRENEIVTLLGTSGCGKSTLLKLLAGLSKPLSGEIRFKGEPVERPHPRAALLFQTPSLLPWLRVDKNVSFGLDFHHQPQITRVDLQSRTEEALTSVSLIQHSKAWPSQLSGGMAQRVALARALARKPHLLFADEPFSALDAITRSEMQQLLLRLVDESKMAVLLVTHDIEEALAISDRIILMSHGNLERQWTVPKIEQEQDLLRHEIHNALHHSHQNN